MLFLPQIYIMKNAIYLLFLIASQIVSGQAYPLGFAKEFEANYSPKTMNKQFVYSAGTVPKMANMQCHVNYVADSAENLLPNGILLVDNLVLGDFVSNISLMKNSLDADSLSGLFFLCGMRDSSNYYFVQLNSYGASFYKMYRNEVSLIDADSSFILNDKTWHNLKVSRDIGTRVLKLESGKMKTEFYDPNLVMGYLGLGITQTCLSFKKFEVWAPTAISKPTLLFR